jgi:hypothetical protein
MHLILHAEDRYNFNPGDADIATQIPDSANGQFELTGLGHQYTNYGTAARLARWSTSSADFSVPPTASAGRLRTPADSRRLRNQL